MKIIIKIFYILIAVYLIFAIQNQFAYSQFSATIEIDSAVEDTLDFGVCMVNDSKFKTIKIKNTGMKDIKITYLSPSFAIISTGEQGHQNDQEEFRSNLTDSTIIKPKDSLSFSIYYKAESDTNFYPYGYKLANLLIGVYDAEIQGIPPKDTTEYIVFKKMTLISRKVRHYLSGWENFKLLDSVHINPQAPFEYLWKISNLSEYFINIDSVWIKSILPFDNNEIQIENKSGFVFSPNSGPISWSINYNPTDTVNDVAIFAVQYSYKDTTDSIFLELRTFPVQQNLKIIETDAKSFNNDTINFGKVLVNSTNEIYAIAANNGNINFLADDQFILDDVEGNDTSKYFSISKPFTENKYFIPTRGDTFKLVFKPDRNGLFFARYKIKSNIDKRDIYSVPSNKLYKIFYIKGYGVSPVLSSDFDTVDFGTIVGHPDCPSSKTFTLKLRNSGTIPLIIENINITSPFIYKYYHNPIDIINPSEMDSIMIIFSANPINQYSGKLIFTTNSPIQNNTYIINLLAQRANPDNIQISISEGLSIKPGNLINIPIVVNKEQIIKARTFSCELTYNRTLLAYLDFDKINTASENTDNVDIFIKEINGGGRLQIDIETPHTNVVFLESDTLINLKFNTFIGDKISTPITLINPVFGDGFCDKILLPETTNGIFRIDSVCGLEQKLIPSNSAPFFISEPMPNPAYNTFEIIYQLRAKLNLKIDLINNTGAIEDTFFDGTAKSGLHNLQINCSKYQPGIYYIRFKSGDISFNKKVIILR